MCENAKNHRWQKLILNIQEISITSLAISPLKRDFWGFFFLVFDLKCELNPKNTFTVRLWGFRRYLFPLFKKKNKESRLERNDKYKGPWEPTIKGWLSRSSHLPRSWCFFVFVFFFLSSVLGFSAQTHADTPAIALGKSVPLYHLFFSLS